MGAPWQRPRPFGAGWEGGALAKPVPKLPGNAPCASTSTCQQIHFLFLTSGKLLPILSSVLSGHQAAAKCAGSSLGEKDSLFTPLLLLNKHPAKTRSLAFFGAWLFLLLPSAPPPAQAQWPPPFPIRQRTSIFRASSNICAQFKMQLGSFGWATTIAQKRKQKKLTTRTSQVKSQGCSLLLHSRQIGSSKQLG